jgi:hypothetical protein
LRRASREESWDSAGHAAHRGHDRLGLDRPRPPAAPTRLIGVATLRGALHGLGRTVAVRQRSRLAVSDWSATPVPCGRPFGLGAYRRRFRHRAGGIAPAGGFAAASLRGEGVRASLRLARGVARPGRARRSLERLARQRGAARRFGKRHSGMRLP